MTYPFWARGGINLVSGSERDQESAIVTLIPVPVGRCSRSAVPRFFGSETPVSTRSRSGRMARCSRSGGSCATPPRQRLRRGPLFLNNRYHDPLLGTFISVDPLVTTTFEPYTYAGANPATLSDPSGLAPNIRPLVDGARGCGWKTCFTWMRDGAVQKLERRGEWGRTKPVGARVVARAIATVASFIPGADTVADPYLCGDSAATGNAGAAAMDCGAAALPLAGVGWIRLGNRLRDLLRIGDDAAQATNTALRFGGHTADDLAASAAAAGRGDLSAAGHALTKHGAGQRASSSAFPALSGSAANINQVAEGQINDILATGNVVTRTHPNHGPIIEVWAPDGRGARWYADGRFFGFLEPGS